MIALISVSLLIFSVIVAIFALVSFRKKGNAIHTAKTNYRAFFIMGIFMVIIGVVLNIVSLLLNYEYTLGFPFIIIGVVYIAIGLNNRDTWKKT